MTTAEVLGLFRHSPIGQTMNAVRWLFGICETLHFIGLSTLVGGIFIVDLRMMGFFRATPIQAVQPLIPVAAAGFALNAFTGLCFFCFDPPTYWYNPDFRLKLILIAIAGANALWFTFHEMPQIATMAADAPSTASMKVSAGLSIGLWIGVIICGRLLEVFAP